MVVGGEEQYFIFYKFFNVVFDKVVEVVGLQDCFGVIDVFEYVVMLFVVFVVVMVFVIVVFCGLKCDNLGIFQQVVEVFVGLLCNMLDDIIGEGGGCCFLLFIGMFVVFIFVLNLVGQFFFLQLLMQNINVIFVFVIMVWIGYNLMGFKVYGFVYFKQFFGFVFWLIFLMFFIEIVSYFVCCFLLGMWLFGNIFGEYVVVGVFFLLVFVFMFLLFMVFGLLVFGIQMFIFVILIISYIVGVELLEYQGVFFYE